MNPAIPRSPKKSGIQPATLALWAAALFILAVLAPFLAHRYAPNEWLYAREFREATALIATIEKFKRDHGHLPTNLTTLGVKEDESRPYYFTRGTKTGHIRSVLEAENLFSRAKSMNQDHTNGMSPINPPFTKCRR